MRGEKERYDQERKKSNCLICGWNAFICKIPPGWQSICLACEGSGFDPLNHIPRKELLKPLRVQHEVSAGKRAACTGLAIWVQSKNAMKSRLQGQAFVIPTQEISWKVRGQLPWSTQHGTKYRRDLLNKLEEKNWLSKVILWSPHTLNLPITHPDPHRPACTHTESTQRSLGKAYLDQTSRVHYGNMYAHLWIFP